MDTLAGFSGLENAPLGAAGSGIATALPALWTLLTDKDDRPWRRTPAPHRHGDSTLGFERPDRSLDRSPRT